MEGLAQQGLDWPTLKRRMVHLQSSDVKWREGKAPLHIYYGGDDVRRVARRAYLMFSDTSALAPKAFPSISEMEREVVAAALDLFAADHGAGLMTSGGTESIILAVKAARDSLRRQARLGSHPGEILLATSAHPAFEKAAHLLGMRVNRVPVAPNYGADVRMIERQINANTVMLVGSVPSLPYGVIDPVPCLSDLALRSGLWLHVDACLGGFIAPFAQKLGRHIVDFDFSLKGVKSLSADLHKFGYSLKGSSVLLFRNQADCDEAGFSFGDWPKGHYHTPTLAGTRPGGTIAAAWAVMRYLGRQGYLDVAERVMRVRDRYVRQIEQIPELHIVGSPALSVVSYSSNFVDMSAVGDGLEDKGWYVSRLSDPPAVHQTLNLAHEGIIDHYVNDVAGTVRLVKELSLKGRQQTVVTY